MARAARLSGEKLRELQDIEEEESENHEGPLPLLERAKVFMHEGIQRWGFWAILAAASIPNPLFDLAGITCGHFLIPFWTFFGATAIGKGVIKVSMQAFFYVIVFSPSTLDYLKSVIAWGAFQQSAETARDGCVAGCGGDHNVDNTVAFLWNMFIMAMLGWFLISIITASANEKLVELEQARRSDTTSSRDTPEQPSVVKRTDETTDVDIME